MLGEYPFFFGFMGAMVERLPLLILLRVLELVKATRTFEVGCVFVMRSHVLWEQGVEIMT